MQPFLTHLEIRVSNIRKSKRFYAKLFKFLGWPIIDAGKDYCGWGHGQGDIWIIKTEKNYCKAGFHRKRTGLNHLAFFVKSRKIVDQWHTYLKKHKISVLYGGPKEYPQYNDGYYSVFFEDPDRIKLEILHWPKKRWPR
ncbi:MAG: VOC family protein [Patescibacteria group bacterium]